MGGLLLNRLVPLLLIGAWVTTPGYCQTSSQSSSAPGSQSYEGPSILSRDPTLIGERSGKLLDFRYYGSISGVYDSGLSPVVTDSAGKLVDIGGNYGVEVGFGAVGNKTWKRDSLSVDYHGAYRHYATNSYFDGTDQFLNLRYGRILSRRVTLDIKETGGITGLGNGAFSYLPLTNNDLVAVPANELFDNTTYYSQTRVGLIWQKTARLSFAVSGQGVLVRRRSHVLAGLNGYSGHGDMSYRVSRRQTASLNYTYTFYDSARQFGNAIVQTVALGYGYGIGRTWDVSTSVGLSFADTTGLESVNLDPAIAAIIGTPSVTSSFHRQVKVPYGQARMVRRFPRSSIEFEGSTGVSPGNGVYLTSRQVTLGGAYSFTGIRRWTVGTKANYTSLSTVGQTIGKYEGFQGGIGTTYKINELLHAEFRYDYRHYTTQDSVYQKDSHRFSVGLAFSPGDKPLPIW